MMDPSLLLSPSNPSNPPSTQSSFLGGPVLSPLHAESPSCVSLACVYAPVGPRHRWVVVTLREGKYEAWRVHEGSSTVPGPPPAEPAPVAAKPPPPPVQASNAWDDDEGGWGDDDDNDEDKADKEPEQDIEALLRAAEETGQDGGGGGGGGKENAPKPAPKPAAQGFSASFVPSGSDLPYVDLTHYPPPASAPAPSVSASAKRYLSSLDPSTDPDVDEAELALIKASLSSSGPGSGGDDDGDDDDDSDDDNDPLSAFSSTLSSDPTQVIRYGYDCKPLYSVSEKAFKPPPPKDCAACGGKRRLEFQVLPRCIYLLGLDGVEANLPDLSSPVVVGEGDRGGEGEKDKDIKDKEDKDEGDKGAGGANNKPGKVKLIDLEKDERCFGNLMVYCCENSCGGEGVVRREEVVFQVKVSEERSDELRRSVHLDIDARGRYFPT